jgi:hypothetical protein
MSLDDRLPASFAAADSPFLPGSNVQFAWDSVSLSAMLSCPRQYKYRMIDGLVSKSPSYAIALVFGILFHRGLEYYHKAAAAGNDHEAATFAAVKALLADPATATLPVDDDIDEMAAAHDPDEDDGITFRNSKIRTRYHLFRALVWYLEHYAEDPVHTILLPSGKPAVELSFRVPLPLEVAGTPMLLCGHIDRGVDFQGSLWSADYKTTKSLTRQFFGMFDLSHQMSGYTVAGNVLFEQPVKGCIIDGVALQVGQVKLARSFTRRTGGQVKEYFNTLSFVAEQAQRHADSGEYPMNTSACYFCDFKEICKQPPEYREKFIDQYFLRKPGWNPLENR